MDISHPYNQKVVTHLSKRNPEAALTLLPEECTRDPYMSLGSHPDIVTRVWKELGSELEVDCRMIVCGTPALVQPSTGIILAFALGTQYCMHLPISLINTALTAGAPITTKWANGQIQNAVDDYGPGWIFGKWLKQEINWCQQSYIIFGLTGNHKIKVEP